MSTIGVLNGPNRVRSNGDFAAFYGVTIYFFFVICGSGSIFIPRTIAP